MMQNQLDFGPRESYLAAFRARDRAWLMYGRCQKALIRAMEHPDDDHSLRNLERAIEALMHWRAAAVAESERAGYFGRLMLPNAR